MISGSSNLAMETLNHYSRLLKPSPSVALILKYYQFKSSFRGTRRVINKRSTPVRIYLVLGSLSCRSFAWIPSIIFVGRRSTKVQKKENTHTWCVWPEKGEERKEIDPACWILVTKYSILTGGRLSFETALSSCETMGEAGGSAAINGWWTT